MLREIVLDTETTGLHYHAGHRIVNVAAVELIDGKPTARAIHFFINPQRPVPPEAFAIHGLTDEFLADKPVFAAIAPELRDFIGNDRVVITCVTKKEGPQGEDYTLDIAFLNGEFTRAGQTIVPEPQWLNVRRWAEAMFGDRLAGLNKLADRYKIERGNRGDGNHGALPDALLLAQVYPPLEADYIAYNRTKFDKKAPSP